MSTPMFQQYLELKARHPDAILFFRMGDFYEMFWDDAEVASRELDLTLTARNKSGDTPIPMAGVPHHAAASYVQRLVDAGYRVAIAEQVEDASKAKGLVARDIVRIVTPGVVLDPTTLEARQPNWLAVLVQSEATVGVSFLDVSTGSLRATEVPGVSAAVAELHRFEPREALLSPDLAENAEVLEALRRNRTVVSPLRAEAFNLADGLASLHTTLGADLQLPGTLAADSPALQAAGAAVTYGRETSGMSLSNVHRLHIYAVDGHMVLDDATRRNLELTKTIMGGKRKGSLLGLLDKTATAMGSRLLREWIAAPLLDPTAIGARASAVEVLVDAPDLRDDLRTALRDVSDIERCGARVAQGTAHARDLAGLARSLAAAPAVFAQLSTISGLAHLAPSDVCADVSADLAHWLVEDPPPSLTEGGLIRQGPHEELNELMDLSVDGVELIRRLEERERESSGITSLKIRSNKVFGFYIEITRANLHRAPEHYIRKQTLTNAERYITPELKELEEKVLGADERRKQLEYELFVALRDRVAAHSERLAVLARHLAAVDVLSNLAAQAVRWRWERPEVSLDGDLEIRGGRHPVVESLLTEERFVPNDVELAPNTRSLIVLTGPNMSGKSTIMRQVALIVLMAQIGSFVPADSARIGVADRIFTRVGAADDLASGRSTFMVEMSETATILEHATERSLVLLDEIGRGTSTYDGLSIAWAVAEDLHDRIGARTLFATHYHELCDLEESREGVVNQSVAVSEWGEQIVFLRRLKEGGASRSYGIQCARLAGLPKPVIDRARTLLTRFEKHAPRNDRQQLSLFGGLPREGHEEEVAEAAADSLRDRLHSIDPDTLSPRDAHAALYELKSLI